MGLLDIDFNDPQTAGLLGLAGGLFQAGQPSRTRIGLGQALMSGLGGMQQGQQGAQQHALQMELLKRKQAQEDLVTQMHEFQFGQQKQAVADQNAQREAMIEYAKRRAGLTANSQSMQSQQAPQQTVDMTRTYSDQDKLDRVTGNYQAPQRQMMQPAPQQQAPQGKTGAIQAQINELNNQADFFDSKGLTSGDAYRQKALELTKMLPKYANEYRVVMGADGVPRNMRLGDDGSEMMSSAGVAEKLHWNDNGQKILGQGEYTGKIGSLIQKQQTPDSIASQATIRRGQDLNNQETAIPAGQIDNMARMISQGRIAPLSPKMAMTPQGLAVMAKVEEMNPTYSGKDYGTGAKAERDFATGKQGNSVRSFNVALSHLDTLSNLSDAMANKDTPLFNKVANYYKTQTGNEAPTNFEAAQKIVGDEIVKSIVGGGGGVADREEAAKTIAAASSPAQLKGVINTYKELMKGQLVGLRDQYRSTTGKDDFDTKYLSDVARSVTAHAEQPKARTVTLLDIAETAKASGKTTSEVTAALKAKGYTIGGM